MATPTIIAKTDRLILRRWRESDRQRFAVMNADPAASWRSWG
jgi:hypothetical protein